MTDQLSTDTDDKPIHFDSREEASALALQLVSQAKREICFFGINLDPVLLNQPELIEYISEFARRSDKTSARFVVHTTIDNVKQSHCLIPLAQRLTTAIKIHTASKKHQELMQMFMLVDRTGYLYFKNSLYYHGYASFNDPLEVNKLRQTFDDIWENSIADINIRRLHL